MAQLPGTPRVHIWTGLVLSLVGVGLGGYAYTGDRAYHIEYVAVAVLGFALVVGGSLLTGYGQANRPRMGGKKARSKREDETGTGGDLDGAGERPSVRAHLAALVDRVRNRGMVEATVACPACEKVFDTRGRPPFETTCPSCGHVGAVERPRTLEVEPGTSAPEPAPASADATNGDTGEAGVGSTARLHRRGADPVHVTLACDHCAQVFNACGCPPFAAQCPSCGYRGTVTGRRAA